AGFRGLAWHFAALPQAVAGRVSVLPTASRTPPAPAGAHPRHVAARGPARASAVHVLPESAALPARLGLVSRFAQRAGCRIPRVLCAALPRRVAGRRFARQAPCETPLEPFAA